MECGFVKSANILLSQNTFSRYTSFSNIPRLRSKNSLPSQSMNTLVSRRWLICEWLLSMQLPPKTMTAIFLDFLVSVRKSLKLDSKISEWKVRGTKTNLEMYLIFTTKREERWFSRLPQATLGRLSYPLWNNLAFQSSERLLSICSIVDQTICSQKLLMVSQCA